MSSQGKCKSVFECEIGEGTIIHDFVDLYKCKIGSKSKIDSFVYIEEGVSIGSFCKIRPFTFIPTGVIIGDYVFIGPNVTFTNDRYPKIGKEWQLFRTNIEDYVSIGAGSVILPGLNIGKNSLIGAGSVVTKDVLPGTVMIGNPARYSKEYKTDLGKY